MRVVKGLKPNWVIGVEVILRFILDLESPYEIRLNLHAAGETGKILYVKTTSDVGSRQTA